MNPTQTKKRRSLLGLAALLLGAQMAPAQQMTTLPASQIPASALSSITNQPIGFNSRTVSIDYSGSGGLMNNLDTSGLSYMEEALGPVSTNTASGLPSAGTIISPDDGFYATNCVNFNGNTDPNFSTIVSQNGFSMGASDANGYWLITTANAGAPYINGDSVSATDNNGPFDSPTYPKTAFPGVPTWDNTSNSGHQPYEAFAVSYTGYVYLPAGTTYLNCNSDDYFECFMSPALNVNDARYQATVANFTTGGRGSATTTFGVTTPSAGWYSVRLDYEQGTGGDVCAFFTSTASGANPVLVNDTSTPGALIAYPTPDIYSESYFVSVIPANGSAVLPDGVPVVSAAIQDGTPAIQTVLSIKLNGTVVPGLSVSNVASFTPNGKSIGNITYATASLPAGTQLKANVSYTAEVDFTDTTGATNSSTWTFVTAGLPLVASNATVNTSARGFIVYPYHNGVQNNDVLGYTEDEYLGLEGPGYATLTNWPDSDGSVRTAIPGPQGSYYINTNYINWDWYGPTDAQGNFTSNNGYPENPFPGIISGDFATDMGYTATDVNGFAELIESWLYFPYAGVYDLDVVSDDGFSLRSGAAPADVFGPIVMDYEGGRGWSDTIGAVIVPTPGYYPFRLMYEEGGGGANCEFQVISNGTRFLVNDPNTNYVNAYYDAATYPPVAGGVAPQANQTVSPATPLVALIVDGKTAGAANKVVSASLALNGTPVTATSVYANGGTTVTYGSATSINYPLGSTNNVTLVYTDSASVSYTNSWTFYVETIPQLGAPLTSADTSAANSGFAIYPWHTGGENGEPNNITWPEEQILGLEGANYASLTNWINSNDGNSYNAVPGPHGYYFPWTNYINFNISGQNGDFTTANGYTDMEFPGIMTGGYTDETGPTVDVNNFSHLILTWINLPHGGVYTMTVNSDDGFSVKSGQAPGDVFGQLLGDFNGGRGSADTTFSFVVPSAGYYPFRLLYEEGGGGANCEWSMIAPNGNLALINDASVPGNYTAWQTASNSPIYVSAVVPVATTTTSPDGVVWANVVDGQSATVASVSIWLNGVAMPTTTSKSGKVTTAQVDPTVSGPALTIGKNNTATIVYTDNKGNSYTNSWGFSVTGTTTLDNEVVQLDPTQAFVVGSGDPNSPGFRAKVVQVAPLSGTQPNDINYAEEVLASFAPNADPAATSAGGWFTNVANLADTTYPGSNGYFWMSGLINLSGTQAQPEPPSGAGDGDFLAAGGYPDLPFPGIPGLVADSGGNMNESVNVEFFTWVEFPSAGLYTLDFNSDDGFRAYEGTAHGSPAFLSVTAAGSTKKYITVPSVPASGGFGAEIPTAAPITGALVAANPPFGDDPGGAFLNAAAIKGNIVAVERGSVSFQTMVNEATNAGALALVILDKAADAGNPAIVAGGSGSPIPVVMVGNDDGIVISNALAAGAVTAGLANDANLRLGEANYGKGNSDVNFVVYAPAAGDYPFLIDYMQGGGGINAEFSQVVPGRATGQNVLINDTANGGLAAFSHLKPGAQHIAVSTPPTLSITKSGGNVVISWAPTGGTLYSSPALGSSASWTSVGTANPATVPVTGKTQFFQVKE